MTPVVIALGSNVGGSVRHLQDATQALRGILTVHHASGIYRTAPMYVEDQPPFMNAVVIAATGQGPRTLLRQLKAIENEIGRQARERYGPREIDLDLIAYGNLSYTFDGGDKPLTVPHPKTVERRFVLMPLSEVAPSFKLIGLGVARDLLDQTYEQSGDVERLENAQL